MRSHDLELRQTVTVRPGTVPEILDGRTVVIQSILGDVIVADDADGNRWTLMAWELVP
jgi:hypothetical protein